MKKNLIITITNNISYDQRINRIATTLTRDFNVKVIGVNTRNPIPLDCNLPFDTKRLNAIFKQGKLFYFEYNLRLLIHLLFSKFDVLYTVDLDSMPSGILIRWLRKFEWIYDAHEYFTELPEVNNRPIVRRVWSFIADKGIPKTDKRITVNQSLADILSEKYKLGFASVRNMPSIKPFGESQEKSNIILYQGAINIGRGLKESILAMHNLPNFRLVLAGDGPLLNELRKITSENQLENVEFLGKVSPDKLVEITKNAFVGINLLDSSSLNYYYSLANKFFDYTMAGVPSINMNFPVYQGLNREYEVAVLLDSLDKVDIVRAISELYVDVVRYNEMRKQCLIARNHWNWEKEEGKLLKIVSERC